MQDQYLRLKDFLPSLGVSEPTIWRWVKRGHFPKPVKIGQRAVAWRKTDLDAWEASRCAA